MFNFKANSVLGILVRRFLAGILTVFIITLLLFFGVELLPGDFAQAFLGQSATPEAVENIRREFNLNAPAYERYIDWFLGVIHGDFGFSWANKNDVSVQLFSRLNNTLLLASLAAIISVPLSIILGMVSVFYKNRWPDRLINFFSLTAISLPEFFIGYILIYFFAVELGWFVSTAVIYEGMGLWEKLSITVLPVLTLVLVVLAHMMRMTRAAILNVLSSAYVETAELKGLTSFRIILKHAAPNAIAPIVNVVALNMAYLVVGVVVVEVIYVYPGLGQYFVDAVTVRDIPVVLACGLVFALVYIVFNTFADLISIISNPRLRHPK